MGGTDSKDVKVDSTGQINNNVIVQDHIEIANKSMMVLYAILAVQIIQLLYAIYRDHVRGIKKQAARLIAA